MQQNKLHNLQRSKGCENITARYVNVIKIQKQMSRN